LNIALSIKERNYFNTITVSIFHKAYQNKGFKALTLNLLFCGISWAGIAQESDQRIFEATIQKSIIQNKVKG
jgi:hypothetical protein